MMKVVPFSEHVWKLYATEIFGLRQSLARHVRGITPEHAAAFLDLTNRQRVTYLLGSN